MPPAAKGALSSSQAKVGLPCAQKLQTRTAGSTRVKRGVGMDGEMAETDIDRTAHTFWPTLQGKLKRGKADDKLAPKDDVEVENKERSWESAQQDGALAGSAGNQVCTAKKSYLHTAHHTECLRTHHFRANAHSSLSKPFSLTLR